MPELSRTQLAVYATVAVALLLVGARALRSGGDREAAFADSTSGSSGIDEGGAETVAIGSGGPDVVVDVTGEVAKPGVYRLPAGARVDDAIARAGGATGRASLEAINLAARLADGQQVLVPGSAPGGAAASAGVVSEDGPISLGSASVDQLETIDGIGPVTAGDIVEFRDEHGGLSSVDQLDQVSGIGPATMEALRDRLQP